MRTPITLVTGFLGSGKTTLLRKILNDTQNKIAIVMNEFGEIAIDAKVLEGKNVNIVEMAGGCVCCSLLGEFQEAVKELIARVAPDSIVVETTGLAEPDAVMVDIEDSLPDLIRLDGVITLADMDAMIRFPQIGGTARMQLAAADIVLFNKCDLVSPEQIQTVEGKVRKLNPTAAFVHTVRCRLDTRQLFGLGLEHMARRDLHEHEKARGTHEEAHSHDIEFESFVFTCDGLLDRNRFKEFVGHMPQEVYRVKALMRFPETGCHFNYVSGRSDFEQCEVQKNEFVFIGKDVRAVEEEIRQRIEGCRMGGENWAKD
jgi:G3E family GTPase